MTVAKTDYEKIASRYDENQDRLRIAEDDVLRSRLADARGPLRVLDLGCGTGNYLKLQTETFREGVTFSGVDPSAAMLEQSRAKLGDRVALKIGSAEQLPYDDASFDYVTTHFAFHHFVDKPRALDEVSRVLAQGGVFRLMNIDPTRMRDWWVYELFPGCVSLDRGRYWAPELIEHELERRGFEVTMRVDVRRERMLLSSLYPDAARREISELAILDDAAYELGLARMKLAIELQPRASLRSEIAIVTLVAWRRA